MVGNRPVFGCAGATEGVVGNRVHYVQRGPNCVSAQNATTRTRTNHQGVRIGAIPKLADGADAISRGSVVAFFLLLEVAGKLDEAAAEQSAHISRVVPNERVFLE